MGTAITNWKDLIDKEQGKPYYQALRQFVYGEYDNYTVYPPKNQIFSALRHTPFESVKVVILGQDPYINPSEAHGMAFSVMPSAKIPPSLKNIFKELHDDLGCTIPRNGYLMPWATQGVLLLNTVLTVRAGESKSHAGKGWEVFTDQVILSLNDHPNPLVFMLWGKSAQSKEALISSQHKTLCAPHPSPLARGGFFGCRHFSKANDFLVKSGQIPINWQL
ncbi:MAG: uracil-DNA glycosylase [Defluviitaleaceae bacterium]|nr:uracil-DNA glycosylase [Defluviitaleaceae bacterium]